MAASLLLWFDKLSSPGWVFALAVIAAGYYVELFVLGHPPGEAKEAAPGPRQPAREFEE